MINHESSKRSLEAAAGCVVEQLEQRFMMAFTALVNFQPSGSATPAGYVADTGAVFGNRGNGFSYGWNLDNAGSARDRNSSASPDQRYDTVTHTQLFGSRTWEIAVPNGTYQVRLVAGDPSYINSVYRIDVEGVLTVDGTPTTGNRWIEGTQTVSVSDGRLTVSNASGANNNKLCFIDITEIPAASSPQVTSVVPADGANGVSVNTSVTATVSLPNGALNTATVNTTTVTLVRVTDQAVIPAAVSVGAGGTSIVLQPSAALAAGTEYEFRVSAGVLDVTGVACLPFTSRFTTAAPPGGSYVPPTDPRSIVELNPSWRFNKGNVTGAQNVSFNDSGWSTVSLPHTWNSADGQDGGSYYRGIGWYRKQYTVPSSFAGKRLFIQFEGANTVTDLYINGDFVGTHEGGFAAFTWDVTSFLDVGVNNVIAVKVNNAFDADVAPLQGSGVIQGGADFTLFGGIYRDVNLIATDARHVTLTDFSSPGVYLTQSNVSAASANLEVKTKVRNDGSTTRNLTVVADVVDAQGTLVRQLTRTLSVPAQQTVDFIQTTTISNPHLWDARNDPYLYSVYVQVKDGTTLTDVVRQPLGFRYYHVDPDDGFFLNGHYQNLHGVNFHQDRINKGWATSEADRVQDLGLIREIGANFVRLSHYQHSETTYDLLDEYGIVAWAEIPFIYDATDSTAFFNNMKQQLQEMIRQNYNHPSVIFWGMFNGVEPESETLELLPELVSLANAEDPRRLTTGATVQRVAKDSPVNFFTDLVGINDYWGWYRGVFSDFGVWADDFHDRFPNQPLGVSEFGAGANILHHEENPSLPDTNGSYHPEEYQNLFHEAHWAQMVQRPYLWAKSVWTMFDFATDERNEGGTPGRNTKGLVTYDRQTKKDAFYFFKSHWSSDPVTYITSRRFTDRPTSTVEVKIYSNASSVQLKVNGVSLGSKTSNNRIFKWTGVQLTGGANTIEAIGTKSGQTYHDTVVWNAPSANQGLRATYYNNIDFTGTSVSRVDPTINFDWGKGSPHSSIGVDTFSARWTGQVQPAFSQTYTFYTNTNDGVRLWVNGVKIIDKWANQATTEWSGSIALQAGQKYDIVMEYFENTSNASAKLSWSSASTPKQIIPSTRLFTSFSGTAALSADLLEGEVSRTMQAEPLRDAGGWQWGRAAATTTRTSLWSATEVALDSDDADDLLADADAAMPSLVS